MFACARTSLSNSLLRLNIVNYTPRLKMLHVHHLKIPGSLIFSYHLPLILRRDYYE